MAVMVFKCGALTPICVATKPCNVSMDAITKCHAVAHQAADQMVSGPLPSSVETVMLQLGM